MRRTCVLVGSLVAWTVGCMSLGASGESAWTGESLTSVAGECAACQGTTSGDAAYDEMSLSGGCSCGGASCGCASCGGASCGGASCGGGRWCGPLCRLFSNRGGVSQFNCGCCGSYKFPVPPLSTYHWPGMYSRQRMVTYIGPYYYSGLILPKSHEPLVEPLLKPPVPSEAEGNLLPEPEPAGTATVSGPTIRASYEVDSPRVRPTKASRVGQLEPASAKIKRLYGIR